MTDGSHPATLLHDTVHQRARLGILAILYEVAAADVSTLKAELGLTDGNLGRHLQVLADAGLVALDRRVTGSRPRTSIHATKAGVAAFRHEVAALRALVEGVE